jgi:hypothetical protein
MKNFIGNLIPKIRPFTDGFDYGIKRHESIEDHHFFTYPFRTDDYELARKQDRLYRKGIRSARAYSRYRYEILLLIYVISSAIIFSRCGW